MNTDSDNNEKLRRSRQRLSIEYLIGLLGYEPAVRFLLHHAGCQLPSRDRVYRFVRRHCIIADHLNHALPVWQLAAKYKMTPGSVSKIINKHLETERAERELHERLEAARARKRNREAA